MKRKKITAITLMLAAVAATSVLGGTSISDSVNVSAASEPYSVALDALFAATTKEDLTFESVTEGEETKTVSAFKLGDEDKVWLKRNVAYAWYEEGVAKNFTATFAFKSLDFKSITINMQSSSAWATEEDKTTNKIVITPAENGISVQVNDGGVLPIAYTAGDKLTLSLTPNGELGEMDATLSGTAIGKFENVGAKYATYTLNDMHTFEMVADFGETADLTDNEETTVLFYELNGQSFYLNADKKIEDNVAPAFVVNEDIKSFLLGSAFSLDYKVIDVMQESAMPSVQVEYYQYNPTDSMEGVTDEFEKYHDTAYITTFTSHNFFQTVINNNGTMTSVYDLLGQEYVAIRFLVGDSTFSGKEGEKAKAVYDLAWYMSAATTIDVGTTGLRTSELKYIPIDKNNAGPTYKVLTADEGTTSNIVSANYDGAVNAFNTLLVDKAKDVFAGSNAYIYLPSLNWLIEDDNGYNGLKLTISYKTETSGSASTTSVTPSTAKIPVSKEGIYEFKIFATDSAGNTMKYYLDGELVDVTASNVWDIEEIPYFTFEIENRGLKMASSYTSVSSRKETKIKDTSYSFSDLKVVGATNLKEAYALYKVNSFSAYNEKVEEKYQIQKTDLAAVTYENIASALDLTKVENGDYFALYLETYATLLAQSKGRTPTAEEVELIVSAFEQISEKGDKVNGKEEYDVYEWSANSQSFKTAEEGEYLILADYWEGKAPSYRAAAYKVIIVESETAVIEGESDWVKNNSTSIVLFSIAGVLLIMIIILLMVKPSDETLDEVEAKAVAKKERVLAKKEKSDEGKKKDK